LLPSKKLGNCGLSPGTGGAPLPRCTVLRWLSTRRGTFNALAGRSKTPLLVFRQIGVQWDIASCSHNYATLLHDEGKLKQAKQSLEEALRIHSDLNDERGVASDFDDLGNVLLSMGDLPGADNVPVEFSLLYTTCSSLELAFKQSI